MQRNLKINMNKQDVKAFHEELEIIKRINYFEREVTQFEELCKRFEKNIQPTYRV